MPNIALAMGGLDRPLASPGRGILSALVRCCPPRAVNRCKRCGRCARIFCTWFQNKRPRTELMRTKSRGRNWDFAVSAIRLFGSEPGSSNTSPTTTQERPPGVFRQIALRADSGRYRTFRPRIRIGKYFPVGVRQRNEYPHVAARR